MLLSPNLLPLWVRAVADPACALPLVASALLLGGFDRIPELGGVIASLKSALVETLGARAPRLLDAGIWTAVAVSLVPTLILVSIALYRYSVRQVYASALAGFRR